MPNIVIVIGGPTSGKTQLVNRLVGKAFEETPELRTGTYIARPKPNNKKIQYWDFGPDLVSEFIASNVTKAKALCLVFDATNPNWVESLEAYIAENEITLPNNVPIFLVGTKIDELDKEKQESLTKKVSRSAFKLLYKAEYVPVSAKTNLNIESLSEKITIALPEENVADTHNTRRQSLPSTLRHFQENLKKNDGQIDLVMLSQALAEASEEEIQKNQALIDEVTPTKTKKRHKQMNNGNDPTKRKLPFSDSEPQQTPYLTSTLRLAGMALMVAAVINLIYLILILTHLASAYALMATMNHLVAAVGGLFGMSAPVAAYGNACASIGFSATTATEVLSVGASAVMGRLGMNLFRKGQEALQLSSMDNDSFQP
ncbi:MAG TPA: hypothetical protein VHD33_03385 [Legionellaceae bacterium]|nr:hypothetical protein [Legionellaceae bacterium]